MGVSKANATSHNSHEESPKRKNTSKGVRKPYVKRACTNCKSAHSACDQERPCRRCIQNGYPHLCVDAERKKPVRKPKPKKQENEIATTEEMYGGPMNMMPGWTYGYAPPNQYMGYAYAPPGYPVVINQQPQMNGQQPLYLHNREPPPTNTQTQMMPYQQPMIHYFPQDGFMQATPHPLQYVPPKKKKEEDSDDDDDMNTADVDIGPFEGYDVMQPDSFISLGGSPPTSPVGDNVTFEAISPIDEPPNNNSALAIPFIPQQPQQPLQLYNSYNSSIFDEPFSPTSPLQHRALGQPKEDDSDIIELITENAANVLGDRDTPPPKVIPKQHTRNNSTLARVEDSIPWSQLLADPPETEDDKNTFLSTIGNGGLRKAKLNPEQLQQLLAHVFEKQSSQSKEITELKQELKKVLSELNNLKLKESNGNTKT